MINDFWCFVTLFNSESLSKSSNIPSRCTKNEAKSQIQRSPLPHKLESIAHRPFWNVKSYQRVSKKFPRRSFKLENKRLGDTATCLSIHMTVYLLKMERHLESTVAKAGDQIKLTRLSGLIAVCLMQSSAVSNCAVLRKFSPTQRDEQESVTRMWKKRRDDARWLKESVAFIGQSLGGSSRVHAFHFLPRRPNVCALDNGRKLSNGFI